MDATRDPRPLRRLLVTSGTAVVALCFFPASALGAPDATAKGKTESPAAHAQSAATKAETAPRPAEAGPTIEAVQARLKELQAAPDTDLPDKARLIELHEEALASLKRTAEHKGRAAELAKKRVAVPAQLELRRRAAEAPPRAAPMPASDAPLADLEHAATEADEQLKAARTTAETLEAEPQRRTARRLEIPQLISAARAKIEEIDESNPADTENASLTKARTLAAAAHRQALTAEIEALEHELQTYDTAAADLLQLDRDAAARALAAAQQRADRLRELINDRRRAESAREAREAQWQAASAEPAVRRLADENSVLADHRRELAEKIAQSVTHREAIEKRLDKVREQHLRMKDKVGAAGLTEAIGQMLRKHRTELMALSAQQKTDRRKREQIGDVQLRLLDYEEQLAALRDLDARISAVFDELPAACEANPDDIRSLLQARREYLTALIKDYNAYFADLVEFDSTQQALLDEVAAYRTFIDERVLWTRSTHRVAIVDAVRSVDAALWLVRPEGWWQVATALAGDGRTNPEICFALVAVLVGWSLVAHRLKRAMDHQEEESEPLPGSVGRSLTSTMKAALVTIFVAAFWPAAIWLLGWRLAHAAPEFAAALGHALQIAASVVAPLVVTRQICRPRGLAKTHFGWPAAALISIRREMRWLIIAGSPLVVAIAMFEAQSADSLKDSLGRFLFIASQALLAVFMFRVMNPTRGGLGQLMTLRPDSWLGRTAYPLYLALAAMPVVLAVLAAAGYYYTSLRLVWRLQATAWLVLMIVVAQAILARWLTAMYRRLAVESALQSKRAWSSEPSQKEEEAASDPAADFAKVDAQTQRLLHSTAVLALVIGLATVWVEVLPAVRIFQVVTLWTDSAGSIISLANLIEAAIVLTMTIVAANNLPGLLDAVLLQRLPMDVGLRYALSSVMRYMLFIVGLALVGAAIGIGWPKIQWLAAAVTFGLGFGLQEIFANFVSGLIVLIERPVRVGDIITVGETTGVVSRIRIRATTIVDGDRKELIVPNKEFITARLVNWTLSDPVARAAIKIGIAYGSDIALAQRLMVQIATRTPQVLSDPAPKALFIGFGESSLNFELSAFVGRVEHLAQVRHQLNTAIEQAFRSSGIEIAVPQRDIHVRSVDAAVAKTSLVDDVQDDERHRAA